MSSASRTLNPVGSDDAATVVLLREFLHYARACPDLWIATGEAIADHFARHEPGGRELGGHEPGVQEPGGPPPARRGAAERSPEGRGVTPPRLC